MKTLFKKFLKYFLISFAVLTMARSQTYQVGDFVEDFTSPICANGEGYWSYDEVGRSQVVWINLFTSW